MRINIDFFYNIVYIKYTPVGYTFLEVCMAKRKNSAIDEVNGGAIIRKYKQRKRDTDVISAMMKMLNRITGRLEGVKKMLEDDRYCGDILMQLAAVQGMLRQCELFIFNDHLKTCVASELVKGNDNILDELEIIIKTFR